MIRMEEGRKEKDNQFFFLHQIFQLFNSKSFVLSMKKWSQIR